MRNHPQRAESELKMMDPLAELPAGEQINEETNITQMELPIYSDGGYFTTKNNENARRVKQ